MGNSGPAADGWNCLLGPLFAVQMILFFIPSIFLSRHFSEIPEAVVPVLDLIKCNYCLLSFFFFKYIYHERYI